MTRPARRTRWLPKLVTLLLAGPACYLAYSLGVALAPAQPPAGLRSPDQPPTRLASGLEADPADLELGEVWEDPEFVRPVTITNRGDREVRVTDLIGGCECTAVEPKSFTLAPGQSQQVRVKIDLTHRYPYQFGMDRRELAVTVHPVFQDRGAAAEGWKVTGVVKSRVSLEGRGLAFADMCGQGGPPVTRKMRATAHVPLAGLEAKAPADKGTARVMPVASQPGKYDILVTPNPDLPLGPFRFEVAVTAVSPDGKKSACASFTIDGEMRSPVRVVPDPVLLGEHPVGTKAEAVMSVRLPGPRWSVDRVETERPDTTVTRVDPIDGLPAYRVGQPVSKRGDGTCQVRFVIRGPEGRLETLAATVLWYGETNGGAP